MEISRSVIRHYLLVNFAGRMPTQSSWLSKHYLRSRQNKSRICLRELLLGEPHDSSNEPKVRVLEIRNSSHEPKARVCESKSKTSLRVRHLDPTHRKQAHEEARGSIAPLIFTYFTIAMILIFIVSNVAATYVARRDLTNRVEGSMLRAAQEIDQLRYYHGGPTTDFLAQLAIDEGRLLVPINCPAAGHTFRTTLAMYSAAKRSSQSARNSHANSGNIANSSKNNSEPLDGIRSIYWKPEITSFSCERNRIAAIVTERFELPFQIPALGITTFENRVEVSAESVYQ